MTAPEVIDVHHSEFIELTADDVRPVLEALRLAGVVEVRGLRISKTDAGIVLDGLHELPAKEMVA